MKLTKFLEKYYFIIIPLFLFVIFFQTIEFGLVGFEDDSLLENSFSRIATKDRLSVEIFRSYLDTDSYIPLTNLFYWSVAQIGSNNPTFFRTANLILLSILSILLVSFFQLFGYNRKVSALIAFLFAIHPLVFSSIGWIPSSSILLSSLFAIISFIFLSKTVDKINSNFFIILHFLTFLLSVLSNELAFVLPIIFGAYLYLNEKILLNLSQKIKIGFSWLIAFVIYYLMLSNSAMGEEVYKFGFENLILKLQLFPELIASVFLPFDMAVISSFKNFWSLIGLFLLILIIVIAKFKNVLNTFISKFSIIWLIFSVLPFILISPANSYNLYDYINLWGIFFTVGIAIFLLQFIDEIIFEKRMFSIGFVAILIAYSFISYYDIKNYKNEKQFWLVAKEHNPDKLKINTKLIEISINEGDYSNAEKYLQKSIKIAPKDMELRFKLSEFYLNQNRIDDAILVLQNIVKEFDNFTAVYQLVSIYLENGKVDAANELAKNQIRTEEEKVKILNIYDIWAKNYFRNKDNVTMIKIMKGVLVFDPDNLQVVNYLLKTYIQLFKESNEKFLIEKINYYENEKNRILKSTKDKND